MDKIDLLFAVCAGVLVLANVGALALILKIAAAKGMISTGLIGLGKSIGYKSLIFPAVLTSAAEAWGVGALWRLFRPGP